MDFSLMRLFVLGAKSPYGELSFRVTFTPGNENLWNIRCLDPRNLALWSLSSMELSLQLTKFKNIASVHCRHQLMTILIKEQ